MICPRLHSSAGQTVSSLCLHLPLVGSRSAGPEPQRTEGWASLLPPACQPPAHRSEQGGPFRDATAGARVALWTWNLLPWARGALQGCHWLGACGCCLAGVRGLGEMPGWGGGGREGDRPPSC